eukprot:scaffold22532_cov93-Cylindrotheca_fusiformis.AAC.1
MNKKREKDEEDPKFFVYTNETKETDIPVGTLTHLRIDSSVKEIPGYAFNDCRALVHVQLPETLTRIGGLAFGSCRRLKCVQFVSTEGSPRPPETPSNPISSELGTIVFPEAAKLQIDEAAFQFCNRLRKIIVCSVSTKLGKGVFFRCSGLIYVQLAEGLEAIESRLFKGCELLTMVKIPSSVTKIGDEAFFLCRSLASVDLPSGLLEIGVGAFQECSGIEALHVPPTVSTIGKAAFSYCTGLKQIELPPTLERIEQRTLAHCRSLEFIEIPSTVSFIGENAFSDCRSVSHMRLPPSLNKMTHLPLDDCCNLISIELREGLLIEECVDREFYGPTLVNLAIPPTEKFDFTSGVLYKYSKLGKVVDDAAGLLRKLKHRFDNSPLNKLCYYQSYHCYDDAMVQLRILMEDGPLAATTQVDEFGMTPLHIMSLSQTPNVDMLLAVMKEGRRDHVIYGRDAFGSTPMDYLCLNRMPTSAEVIRRVVQTRFGELLGLDRSWKSNMLQGLEEALALDGSSRRHEVVVIYLKLANYEPEETLSFLLELCLWKIKIDDEASTKEETPDREFCRVNSGASVVIPHVLSFLDKLDVEDHYFSLRDRRTVQVVSRRG